MNDLLDHQADSEVRERCHQIIFELNRAAPNTLLYLEIYTFHYSFFSINIYVMPHLETQLTVEHDDVRADAARLLSRMFANKGSTLHVTYRKLFEAFLGRFADKNDTVREVMLDFASHYLVNHSDQSADISNLLTARLRDLVENVRHKAVLAVCTIAETRPDNITSGPIDEVLLRMRDKKVHIRFSALS